MAKDIKKKDEILVENPKKLKCPICGKTKLLRFFFKSKDERFDIYGDGRCYYCKDCLKDMCYTTNGIPDKDGFKKVLREYLNLPFFDNLYIKCLDNDKDTLGSYISQLNIAYKGGNLTWEDGETSEKQQTDNKAKLNIDVKDEVMIYSTDWRGYYTQSDIDYLNQYLSKLQDDFNIITTNHLDYAKKIAKASLAVDKAYEDMLTGNKDADKRYKDLQSIFDNLSKSAQFSENSRSANDVGISGISQVVDKIESKQWIYEVEDFPKDSLDHLLGQFSNIGKSL